MGDRLSWTNMMLHQFDQSATPESSTSNTGRKVTRQVFCTIDGNANDDAQEELCAKLARYARSLGFDVAQDHDYA